MKNKISTIKLILKKTVFNFWFVSSAIFLWKIMEDLAKGNYELALIYSVIFLALASKYVSEGGKNE